MESVSSSWWSRHGGTAVLLLTAFSLTFLIRTLFAWSVFTQWGWLYVFGGGSDSFYHWRVTDYILLNHTNLVHDSLLRYPVGATNPREPLFDWMNAILGILLAPFFQGNQVNAAAFALDIDPPIWSALSVFPIYLIGREVSSRRMGLVAALTYPFVVGSLQAAVFGYANYLTFYTFFILVYLFAFLKTVKLVGTRTWVTNFRDLRSVGQGLRAFLQTERMAVKWSVFSGVALGALALAWQGYPLVIAIVVIFLIVIMVVERIRRVDSFGLYVVSWLAGLIGFPMAVPYYLAQGLFATWFDLPLLLYFGVLLILLPFVLLRQYPWVVTIPVLGALAIGGVGVLYFANRQFFNNLVTGQGYFAKTLIYSTVAEAQAPSVDALILAYGVITFFLAFVGLALFIVHLARKKFRREHTFFVVFALVSIYLPISAAKFFYVGSPAFALLPAEVILLILDVAGYPSLRRTAASLAGARGQLSSFRRAFKARHVLIFLLVAVLLVPNIWNAIDAGVPYNSKAQYNTQVYDTLPPFLRTSSANASNYYFGASGTELDTPNQYDEAGYDWLAQQDNNLAYPARPAFMSWWDYGFQAASEGGHPTVADNFQNGIDPAGNFLLSQNESEAIGILSVTLLQAEQQSSGRPYLPAALDARLASDGVNLAELHTLMVNTSADIPLVIAHPERYLPVDAAHLDAQNAMYIATSWFLATSLSPAAVAQVYDDVQAFTGWSIRYAMVDTRLFPLSGQQTGIFYAPADLTDRIIGPGGIPTTYFTVTVTATNGNTYPLGQVPPNVQPVPNGYSIQYSSAFYNTMIYHIFAGYNGTQVGQSAGIPGDTNALAGDPALPGWMLHHFQVVYRTGYYCPHGNVQTDPSCRIAANAIDAPRLAARTNGTAGVSTGFYYGAGEAFLEYYPGQPMSGTVTLSDGTPVAGARITVLDEWHIPHVTEVTGQNGTYSVLLPPGNDTVNVTAGNLTGLNQSGNQLLTSIRTYVPPAVGLSLAAPPAIRPIVLAPAAVQGFVYWNAANNSSYRPSADPLVAGAVVTLGGPHSTNYTAVTDAGGGYKLLDVAPGAYNVSVTYQGNHYPALSYLTVGAGRTLTKPTPLQPASVSGNVRLQSGKGVPGAVVTVTASSGVSLGVTSGSSGAYSVKNLPPGNYTVRAQLGTNLGSNATVLSLSKPGVHARLNLTVGPVVTLDLGVIAASGAVPSFPVRFTPILGSPATNTANGSRPVPAGGFSFSSDVNGFVHATLPVGNYSVYGLGYVGGQLYAGFESSYLPTDGGEFAIPPLVLEPAVTVTGSSPLPANVPSSAVGPTEVVAYDPRGDQVQAFASASGRWTLQIPTGSYTFEAVSFGRTASTGNFAGLTAMSVNGPLTLALPLAGAFRFYPAVGAIVRPDNTFFPARAASVQVTVSPVGATISELASQTGNTSFLLPEAATGTTYCVAATHAGFGAYSACALSPMELGSLSRLLIPLNNVSLTVSVTGLPSGGVFHLNVTALGPPAASVSVSGGASLSLSLPPGSYSVSGWAPPSSGNGLLRPIAPVNFSIPIGAPSGSLTLPLYQQLTSRGTLSLPAGLSPGNVTVRVYGPPVNLTINGTTFERGFIAPPGSYSAYASATSTGGLYVNFTRVSISSATGAVSPSVVLRTGVVLIGSLLLPNGTRLNATVPISWSGPGLSTFVSVAVSGRFSVVFPMNTRVAPFVNASLAESSGGVVRFGTFTSIPGSACTVGTTGTTCDIQLTATFAMTTVSGSFSYRGLPVAIPGTVRLVGPEPGDNLTVLTTSDGSFSATVLPGTYALYVTAGSGSGQLANVSTVTVSYPSSPPIDVGLVAAWTDTLTLSAPFGTNPTAANVTWASALAGNFTLPGLPFGTPMLFPLPVGPWQVNASTTTVRLGALAPATSGATVNLLFGNQATQLSLATTVVQAVTFSAVSPGNATLPDGGGATFSFVVRNTGDTAVEVRFVGLPSSWDFTFVPASVLLGIGASASGSVTVRVPGGTPVNHPSVLFEAVLVGSPSPVVGTTNPGPTVAILPQYGLNLSSSTSALTVIPRAAQIPFTVTNTGNLPESIKVSVSDAARLQQLGWTVALVQATTPVVGPLSVPAESSAQAAVRLSTTTFALPPGTVTVAATVLNQTSLTQQFVLTVPVIPASFTGPTVTGPDVGGPPLIPSDFYILFALLPAIAFLAAVLSYRWWRTRRWIRR